MANPAAASEFSMDTDSDFEFEDISSPVRIEGPVVDIEDVVLGKGSKRKTVTTITKGSKIRITDIPLRKTTRFVSERARRRHQFDHQDGREETVVPDYTGAALINSVRALAVAARAARLRDADDTTPLQPIPCELRFNINPNFIEMNPNCWICANCREQFPERLAKHVTMGCREAEDDYLWNADINAS